MSKRESRGGMKNFKESEEEDMMENQFNTRTQGFQVNLGMN